VQIEKTRLKATEDTMQTRLAVQESKVEQMRALVALRRNEMAALKVRAGFAGMLQLVPVEVGAQVAPGEKLARVANPSRLKAELKIAETQTKDIQMGQIAEIDTRIGTVKGHVIRIDPSVINGTRTVDVSLDGDLPKGAVPDLSVDGTIELERLPDVLYMGRPAFGQEQTTITLFKIDPDGAYANRTQVKLGVNSVTAVEVLSGLKVGDRVILSDMSQYDAYDRVKLK
jgi:HlyD family secretion protein